MNPAFATKISILGLLLSLHLVLYAQTTKSEHSDPKMLAIAKVIEFEATKAAIQNISNAYISGVQPNKILMLQVLGAKNLSAFLLALDGDAKVESYEISIDISGKIHPSDILQQGRSLVSLENITSVEWPSEIEGVGSFAFTVSNLYKGKCMFKVAETNHGPRIEHLWIPHKRDNTQANGLCIF